MPIYEYACKACGHQFEALVLGSRVPACAACGGLELERLLSLPHVKSSSTEARAMKAAKQRDHVQAVDRTQAQIAYEKSHDDG